MDPTTAHQQPSLGSELALSSNSAGQTINYHTTHEARLDHAGARSALNITERWGVFLLNSRKKLLAELSPDLNQEYDDWHLTSTDSLQAFREQREDADPDADLKIRQLDGALLSTPAMETNLNNSRPLRSMANKLKSNFSRLSGPSLGSAMSTTGPSPSRSSGCSTWKSGCGLASRRSARPRPAPLSKQRASLSSKLALNSSSPTLLRPQLALNSS